jgi:hypothetical protein
MRLQCAASLFNLKYLTKKNNHQPFRVNLALNKQIEHQEIKQ